MNSPSRPSVCVCVPTYNAGLTLAETLDSILAQTYKDLHVFIVDNASTDNTLEVAGAYAKNDPRITIFRNDVNVGAEGNFTRCIQLADGDYTAIFHSDDLYLPGIVALQVEFLEGNRKAGAVFAMAENIDEEGLSVKVRTLPEELRGFGGGGYTFARIFRAMLKYGNFLYCPGAMVRTRVYKEDIRSWNGARYGSSADGDVWLRIALRYPVGIIEKTLLRYRLSVNSFSYHAARAKTTPHNMFVLFDDYIKGPAGPLMGRKELNDYAFLRLRDDINRAFNLMLSGKRGEAFALLSGVFRPELLRHGVGSLVHLKVLVYGYFVLFCLSLPMTERIRNLIWRIKFGAG